MRAPSPGIASSRRVALHRLVAAIACALALGAASCSSNATDAPTATGASSTGTATGPTPPVEGATIPTTPPPTIETSTTTSTGTATTPDLDAVSIELTEVSGALDEPVAMATRAGDDAIYIASQRGRVVALRDDGTDPEVVLDLSSEVTRGYEQGLLGIAFSPDGGHLYVHFTDRSGDTRVEELEFDGRIALEQSRRAVLVVDQPFQNHNGGDLRFGPDDLLYIALGDGGASGDPLGSGQDTTTLLGSILRIDPTGAEPYSVPADNPFVGGGGRPEIWHYGLRNPWRFSFDRATGDMWIGDVGQSAWEEIDLARAGERGINWGWSAREGAHAFAGAAPPDARDPIHEYPNPDDGIAVTGGFVYRGEAIPELSGVYVFADFETGDLMGLVEVDGVALDVAPLGVNAGSVASFGEDANGELYVLDLGGRLLRIDPR